MKFVIFALSLVFLSGCSLFQPKIKLRTETQEVLKPILYCPAPNWEQLDQPILAIDDITLQTSDGEVAKRYKASIKQYETYVDLLRKSLEKYNSTSKAYNELEKQFLEERSRGGFKSN